jgi:hypothetical protein
MTPVGLDLDVIDRLTGRKIGTFDTTCPFCSAFRSSPANRRAKVFRIYRTDAAERDRKHKAERLNKARWLWSQRKAITGSIAETYLRKKLGTTALRAAIEKQKVDLTKPAVLQADRERFPR